MHAKLSHVTCQHSAVRPQMALFVDELTKMASAALDGRKAAVNEVLVRGEAAVNEVLVRVRNGCTAAAKEGRFSAQVQAAIAYTNPVKKAMVTDPTSYETFKEMIFAKVQELGLHGVTMSYEGRWGNGTWCNDTDPSAYYLVVNVLATWPCEVKKPDAESAKLDGAAESKLDKATTDIDVVLAEETVAETEDVSDAESSASSWVAGEM
jgi:hypothetical protein